MNVVKLLKAEMFDVEIQGKPASIAQALPNWNPHDRFGLVIDEALGGIGATHCSRSPSLRSTTSSRAVGPN